MVTSVFAMNTAIQKAKTAGVAYVGVRNSCHFGAAGYYAKLAAKADMIGMAMANDIPSMAVPGSRKAVLGTNPFAYAVPAGKEAPIFLDIASSAAAGGKIRILQALGQKVPDNWLVDAEGAADQRPVRLSARRLLAAVRRPQGLRHRLDDRNLRRRAERRGQCDGISCSWIDHDPSLPTHHGAAFLAIDVGQMMPIQTFKDRVDAMIRDIHADPQGQGHGPHLRARRNGMAEAPRGPGQRHPAAGRRAGKPACLGGGTRNEGGLALGLNN